MGDDDALMEFEQLKPLVRGQLADGDGQHKR